MSFQYKILFNIYIIIIAISVINNISFSYPNSITLKNKNILVIHKYGISICNLDCSIIIKEVKSFSVSEQISNEEKLSKVTISQFNNGYIISIIIDKIYIFDFYGELEYETTETISSYSNIYYTLASHKIINNYYFYLFGYAYNQELYLYYYRYCSQANGLTCSEINRKIASTIRYKPTNGYIASNALSCQFTSENEKILCMHYLIVGNSKLLSANFLNIIGNNLIFNSEIINFEFDDVLSLKSANFPDGQKSIFCFYNSLQHIKCLFYQLNIKYEYYSYSYDEINCITKHYAFNIKYFPEKEQFVFSCLEEDGGIIFMIYNMSFAYPEPYGYPYQKFTEYQRSIYGHSILYYTIKDCYYVLFDLKYNEIEYTFKTLKNSEDNPTPEETQNITQETTIQDLDTGNQNGNNIENGSVKDESNIENNIENNSVKDESNTENNIENNSVTDESNTENKKEFNNIIENTKSEEIKGNEIKINECKNLNKCGLCNEESISNNLCLSCNTQKGYFPLNYDILPIQNNKNYIECINFEEKPKNFYFDTITNDFNPCYESCATCDYGGNSRENNCTSCEINYIFKPDFKYSTNCVTECLFSYYYSNFGQYRCTSSSQCPDGYNFYIKDKGKCFDKCENDNIYKYQYNGECLNNCPVETKNSLGEYLCKDINIFNCLLSSINYISWEIR